MDISAVHNMGKKLSVNIGTTVKLEVEGVEYPLQSGIVGLEKEKYIILKAPEPFRRIEHKLYPDNELIVRYISDGTVYAFQSKIIEYISSPLRLLFIEYPKVIEHHELRGQKRIICHLPAKIIANEIENLGCIFDISKKGCRFILHKNKNPNLIKIEINKGINLKCVFPGSNEVIYIAGQVQNLKKTYNELDIGIIFTNNNSVETMRMITWFISTVENLS
ncbi:MAG: flagellar brake domain-containing protein [Thermodesulfobacteriota bacterium]